MPISDLARERIYGLCGTAEPWQEDFYVTLTDGGWPPPVIRAMSGRGERQLAAVWLAALAEQPDRVPPRLVFAAATPLDVVAVTLDMQHLRRRLVADEALSLALVRLSTAQPDPIVAIDATGADPVLSVSSPWGPLVHDGWASDPGRPTVLVGTADTIGEALLFRCGGPGRRAVTAGLIGHDSLLVTCDRERMPAFCRLANSVKAAQLGSLRPMRTTALTVVPDRPVDGADRTPRQWSVHRGKAMSKAIERQAGLKSEADEAVLVCVTDPDLAWKFAAKVKATFNDEPAPRVLVLDGRTRGAEVAAAMATPLYTRFVAAADRAPGLEAATGRRWLVVTPESMGSMPFAADGLVCDPACLDVQLRRFAAVKPGGWIALVTPDRLPQGPAAEATRLLRDLTDASPYALATQIGRATATTAAAACTPSRPSRIVQPEWLDRLTLTSRVVPGTGNLREWTEGFVAGSDQTARVAWREEVAFLGTDPVLLDEYPPDVLLDLWPVTAWETLTVPAAYLAAVLVSIPHGQRFKLSAWLVDGDGQVETVGLVDLLGGLGANTPPKHLTGLANRLAGRLVLLPPNARCCSDGQLVTWTPPPLPSETTDRVSLDVSCGVPGPDGEPWRHRGREVRSGMRRVLTLRLDHRRTSRTVPAVWYWDVERRPGRAPMPGLTLADHHARAVRAARRIAERLLPVPETARSLVHAAGVHDLGKGRPGWQSRMGWGQHGEPMAKPDGHGHRPNPSGYRHEFGSLLDVASPPEATDLTLHLVAAHHGRARPFFEPGAIFDPQHPDAFWRIQATAVPRRFASLQARFGRWGLAWLEALLRAADIAASGEEGP